MATVRDICTDALREINVYAPTETPSANDLQSALRYLQRQLDSWQAEALTLAVQARVSFTLTSGSSTVTIGPGGTVDVMRPVYLDAVNYVNPGSSPGVEIPIGLLDRDTYAALSIKELASALPLQCFYQTSTETALGTLFVWPQVTQNVTLVLYYPKGIAVPVTVDDIILAPPGYAEGFHYNLARRLLSPFGVADQMTIARVTQEAEQALMRLKRPNLQPGQMGIDAALVPSGGGAYNIYSDSYTGSSNR
jgi:hypothetical protein